MLLVAFRWPPDVDLDRWRCRRWCGEGVAGGRHRPVDHDLRGAVVALQLTASPAAKVSVPLSVSVWPSRDLHRDVGPHVQRRPRRHREAAGEDVLQVRRVGADLVQRQRRRLGSVSAWMSMSLEGRVAGRGTARRRRARRRAC